MGHFSCIRIAPIPIPKASHSISKALLKSGKDSKGAEVNFDFNKLKTFSCSSSHLKTHDFLNNFSQWRGYRTKVFNKSPIKTSQTMKTTNICWILVQVILE